MTAYYNEIDPKAAAWLRELIKNGLIAPGEVDERSIEDVTPNDVRGFTQCHFFAGIGAWSHALRKAGWPDDRPVWTGSCPCQPFSAAGKGAGFADERHLWPVFHRLIRECRPEIVFGEQVSSSLVTGKFRGHDVQSLWQARQFLDFRKDWLQWHFPLGLQGMPEFGSASVFEEAAAEHRDTGEQAGGRSQEPGEGPRASVRSGCGVGTGKTGGRDLPIEREAVRPIGEAEYEHAVARSDRPEGRVCEDKHTGDTVWSERGSRHLGAGKVVRCSRGGDEDAIERLNDLIAEVSGDLEEENGQSWLDALYLDLGRDGYTCGACVTPAAGFGAPHIRQRLYWVADAPGARHIGALGGTEGEARDEARLRLLGAKRGFGELADADRRQRGGIASGEGCINHGPQAGREQGDSELERRCEGRGLADAESAGRQYPAKQERRGYDEGRGINGDPSQTNGFWRDSDWLFCRDGKWRPVEPSTFPLANGATSRVGRLRGYGNAIVAAQAQGFIEAFMDFSA